MSYSSCNMCGLFVLIFVAVSLLPSLCLGTNNTDNPACSFPNSSACIDDCFLTLPPDVIYLSEGDKINISVVPVPSFPLSFFTTFKDGTAVSAMNAATLCKPQYCVFDLDSPRLEITSFNTTFSAAPYSFDVFNQGPDVCRFSFNITKAVPPTLMKEADPTTMLDEDRGSLVLSPTVFHGIPPGFVDWYKDGINISRGDIYRKEKVTAEDRGVYTAKIQHQTGEVSLQYELRVRFAPIITLTTDPADTNPTLVTDPITVICSAISYPMVQSITLTPEGQSDTTIIDSTEDEDFHFEAKVMSTTSSGCPSLSYRCDVGNGVFTASKTISICQKAPNVTSLSVNREQSTDVSAYLTWLLTPSDATVSSYRIRYRIKGNQSFTIISDQDTSDTAYRVEGLSPGVEYEFGVSAIDLSDSTQDSFSSSVFFTTFRRPVDVPTNLRVTRTDSAITLEWNEPTDVPIYAPITGYDVIYHTSEDSSPQTVSVGDENSYTFTHDNSLSYFFTLRATNEWGESDLSGEVESRMDKGDPNPPNISVQLTVTVDESLVVLSWDIESSREKITRLVIQISGIEPGSSNQVELFPVLTHNVTDMDSTNEACFSNLNSTSTYQFCLQPYTESGVDVPVTCKLATTSSTDLRVSSSTVCYPVVMEQVSSESVIPSWAIAVIVVSAVGLVFVFFGGCGLYFGCKKTKKNEIYEGPNEAFEKMPNNGINGNYPYPPPPRSVSPPSRSCMSYRHNNHGHHLDWQGVTAV